MLVPGEWLDARSFKSKSKRRLHWGRARPRSGILRLEMRGRFGQTPQLTDPRDELVNNKLGAP
jgi:hypothetical protein